MKYLKLYEDLMYEDKEWEIKSLIIYSTYRGISNYYEMINRHFKKYALELINDSYLKLLASPDEPARGYDLTEKSCIYMEETGVYMPTDKLKFVGRFDKLNRDPRMKICVSYAFSCVLTEKPTAIAQDDASDVTWLNVNVNGDLKITDDSGNEVKMAFDHYDVIKKALESL